MLRTRIISDLHLGSDVCQAEQLHKFLKNLDERCDRLILNGDVFDSIDFRRLKKSHWKVLSDLRKLSDKMEVIWIAGNHDGSAEIVSHLLGIPVYDEFQFDNVLVTHGHQFDRFMDDHPWLTIVGDFIYSALQKIDKSHTFARMAKHSSKHYLRCADEIMKGAVKLAQKKGCDIVCCGHTHFATKTESLEGVTYLNSGCWTENPCYYLELCSKECFVVDFNHDED